VCSGQRAAVANSMVDGYFWHDREVARPLPVARAEEPLHLYSMAGGRIGECSSRARSQTPVKVHDRGESGSVDVFRSGTCPWR
jgi:hypothetical protein